MFEGESKSVKRVVLASLPFFFVGVWLNLLFDGWVDTISYVLFGLGALAFIVAIIVSLRKIDNEEE